MDSAAHAQKWLESVLENHTKSITGAISQQISQQLSTHLSSQPSGSAISSSQPAKPKASKTVVKDSSSQIDDEDAEFDRRFGHLFGVNINDDHDNDESLDEVSECEDAHDSVSVNADKADDANVLDDEDNVSVDDDLLDGGDTEANWTLSSSIGAFLANNADKKLSEEFLKQIDSDLSPVEKFQEYFSTPHMPRRLFKIINKMKSKAAARTERALFNTQKELLTSAKPLVSALHSLKPLGSQVSQAREQLSVTLRGIFSTSLGISRARRENVRFLFKIALADVLYEYEPSHLCIFGGKSFVTQIEKASKEAKLDLSWGKKDSKQPFRGSQGFQARRFQNRFRENRFYNRFSPYGNNRDSNNNYGKKGSSGNKAQGKSKGASKSRE